MSDGEASTRPTIEIILERIDALRVDMERRFDDLNMRLDRIESVAYSTRGEFVEMRADFREFRAQFK